MTRELGPMMTGIVMTGRTGASFAAVLGTMTVNEEVDALVTMGLRPMEFLVLPRVLATALMLPALVAYADFMGMLGGLFVGVTMLHLGTAEYLSQTREALTLAHVWIGLGKSVVFGIVVALTGCYYGIRCGRSAAAVGVATTGRWSWASCSWWWWMPSPPSSSTRSGCDDVGGGARGGAGA